MNGENGQIVRSERRSLILNDGQSRDANTLKQINIGDE